MTANDRILVQLIGEANGYLKMLAEAQRATQQAQREIATATRSIEGMKGGIESFGSSAVSALAAVTGGLTAMGAAVASVRLAAEFESTTIAFETMLRSAEAGQAMVRDLQRLAAETPLTSADVLRSARTLLSFGIEADRVTSVIRMLGDVTGGEAERFRSLSLAFAQMSAAGRLMGQDLLQMINAGFNPLQVIAKQTGKSMAQLKKEMEEGKITVDLVNAAFRAATSEGGQFANLMLKQSKSLTGLWSTMVDDLSIALRTIGGGIVEFFRLREAMGLVSSGAKTIGTELGALGKWLGSLPPWVRDVTATAVALGAALVGLSVTAPYVVSALAAVKGATLALSASILANPITWWVVGLGAAVGAILAVGEALKSSSAEAQAFNNALKAGQAVAASIPGLFSSSLTGILGRASALAPEARKSFLSEQIERATKDLEHQQAAVGLAEKELAKYNTFFNRLMGANNLKIANEYLATQQKLLQGYKERLAELQQALKNTKAPWEDPKTLEALDKLNRSLKEQLATVGMTATQAQIAKLALMGATDAQLAQARRMAADIEDARQAKALADDVNRLTDELNVQVETFGMSADAVRIWKLQLSGATEEQVKLAKGLAQQKEQMEAQAKLFREGERLAEQMRTPAERYADRIEELEEMLGAGAIEWMTYERAVEAAEKDLAATAKTVERLTGGMNVLAGSAEALRRVQEWQDKLRAPTAPESVREGHRLVEARGMAGVGEGRNQELAVLKEMNDRLGRIADKKADNLLLADFDE